MKVLSPEGNSYHRLVPEGTISPLGGLKDAANDDEAITFRQFRTNLTSSNRILTGGIITRATNQLQFNIADVTYNIAGIEYSLAATNTILTAGDATFARFDALVLTPTGYSSIAGTASATPSTPTIPSNNILVSYVNVPALASSVSGGSISSSCVYLSKNGNDNTGQRGNKIKQFLTYDAALAIAQYGDVMVIEDPGVYVSTAVILKHGVNIFAASRVTIASALLAPMTDQGNLTVVSFFGDLTFNFTHTNGSKIQLTGTGSSLTFNGTLGSIVINDSNTNATFGVATMLISGSGTALTMKYTNIITAGGRPLNLGSAGANKATVNLENCEFGSAGNTSINFINKVYFRARRCTFNLMSNGSGTGAIGITRSTTTSNGDFIFEDCRIIDSGNWYSFYIGLAFTGNGLQFLGTNIIYNAGTATSFSFNPVSTDVKILGTVYTNTAPSGTYVVKGGGSLITDADVAYFNQ